MDDIDAHADKSIALASRISAVLSNPEIVDPLLALSALTMVLSMVVNSSGIPHTAALRAVSLSLKLSISGEDEVHH